MPELPALRTHRMPQTTDSSNTEYPTSKSWCTGEDSNLRSSQGAADLQSAAINHSATCAHSTEHSLSSKHAREPDCRGPESPVPAVKERQNQSSRTRQNSATAARSNFRASYDWEAAAGFSSLGELRVSFGLLLLRLAARSKVTILELAKGLEPPTL
jgi:hypothetical protein